MTPPMPPVALLADLSALSATWRHYAGLERADVHDPANATPSESLARASAWGAAADELDELMRRHVGEPGTVEPWAEPGDQLQHERVGKHEPVWEPTTPLSGRGFTVCAHCRDTWPCVEVKRIAADLAGFPQVDPEPEPHEVTLEWSEVEPDPDGEGVPEGYACQALYEHLRRQHGQTDLPAEHLHMLVEIHGQQRHGRARGLHRVDDHDRVRERAAELYRAARKREQKAGAR